MIQQSFSKQQVKQLLKNEHVLKFCGTYFAYTPAFKIEAVKQYNQGIKPREIFRQAGFDLMVIGKHKPNYLLYDWRKIYKTNGAAGFAAETRGKGGGRQKSIETLTDSEKIKRLKLEIKYLKKENDFLVRLRARRAE